MFPVTQNDIIEVTMFGKCLGQDMINVVHFSGKTQVAWANPADSIGVGNAILVSLTATLVPLQSVEVLYSHMHLLRIDGWSGTSIADARPLYGAEDIITPAGLGGLTAGACLPSYAAVTGRKRTTELTRKYTGSYRVAGIPEADSDVGAAANNLTGAAHVLWQAAWSSYAGTAKLVNATDFTSMGVFSLKAMVLANPPGPVGNPSLYWRLNQATLVNKYLGSQVSRKIGHGK